MPRLVIVPLTSNVLQAFSKTHRKEATSAWATSALLPQSWHRGGGQALRMALMLVLMMKDDGDDMMVVTTMAVVN